MKTAILAALVSFSAMASECYVRTVDLVTTEVTMAKEICINSIDLNLVVTGRSSATVNYTLDGVSKAKKLELIWPIERRDGKVMFIVGGLESNWEGGYCGDTIAAEIEAMLVMNKDGSNAEITELKGSVSTSNDNCHSDMREIQAVPFVRVQ